MSVARRLDEVDRKFARRRELPYDAPLPWWFRYGFAWPLPLVASLPVAVGEGGWWWVLPAIGCCLVLIAYLAIFRWDLAHKRVVPTAE